MNYDEYFKYHHLKQIKPKLVDDESKKMELTHHSHFKCIYFIKSQSFIKIGSTCNLSKRIVNYKQYNPNPELIGLKICNTQLEYEKELQSMFSIFNFNGEWFNFTTEIEDHIKSIMDNGDMRMLMMMNNYLKLNNKSRNNVIYGKHTIRGV